MAVELCNGWFAQISHYLLLLLQGLWEGCWPTPELVQRSCALRHKNFPEQKASLLLAIYSACLPHQLGILLPKHICQLGLPRAHLHKRSIEALMLSIAK